MGNDNSSKNELKHRELLEHIATEKQEEESKQEGLSLADGIEQIMENTQASIDAGMDAVAGVSLLETVGKTETIQKQSEDAVNLQLQANKAAMSPSQSAILQIRKRKGTAVTDDNVQEALEKKIQYYKNNVNFDDLAAKLEKIDKKGSDSYVEVKKSLTDLSKELEKHKEEKLSKADLSACVAAIFRANEAVRGYNASHKGTRKTVSGEVKQQFVLKIGELFQSMMGSITEEADMQAGQELDEDEKTVSLKDVNLDEISNIDIGALNKRVNEFKQSYDAMTSIIGTGYIDKPQEKIKKRLTQFRFYEKELKTYRAIHKYDMSKEMKDMYREMDALFKEERLLDWMTKNVDESINRNDTASKLRTLSFQNANRQDKKLGAVDKRYDDTLEPEQVKAIHEIDQWFIRNWNNGGLAGKFVSFLKAGNADMLNELFSRSMRERLHIYYLIETRARKNPGAMDVGRSQMYVPTLAGFKKQMLATRWKLKQHMTSGYVYYTKLSEAMFATSGYSAMINRTGQLLSGPAEKQEEKTEENKTGENKIEQKASSVVNARQDRLEAAAVSMLKLANLKKKQEELKEKDRGIVDTAIAVAQKDAQEKLQALIDADIEVKKEFAASDETTNVEYSKEDTKEEYTHYGALAVFGGITAIGKVPWGLDDMQLVSTPMAGSAKAIGNLAACFFSLANLQSLYKENTISDARLAEETLSTVATIGETAVDIWQNVEFVATGAEEVAQFSTGLVAASGALAVIQATAGMVKMGASLAEGAHTTTAWGAFKEMRRKKLADKNLSEDEKKKLRRDMRYEDAVLVFSEKNQDRRFASGAMLAGAGAIGLAGLATGLAVSGVGIVFTVLGVAVSVVAGVVDGIMAKRSNNAFFDKFVNMDSIEKQVRPELEKRGQVINDDKAFREQLRKRVATTLGFADVPTACDQLATVSAKQLYGKLFEENLPEDELKPYIETVKALGLKYRAGDESNRKPDLLTLKKAISGR